VVLDGTAFEMWKFCWAVILSEVEKEEWSRVRRMYAKTAEDEAIDGRGASGPDSWRRRAAMGGHVKTEHMSSEGQHAHSSSLAVPAQMLSQHCNEIR
jgi:hypothetical protein